MQLKGTPGALDTRLTVKLDEYREARSVARETAHYAATVRTATEAHRKATQDATKPKFTLSKPTAPASQEEQLTVETSPRDATCQDDRVIVGPTRDLSREINLEDRVLITAGQLDGPGAGSLP